MYSYTEQSEQFSKCMYVIFSSSAPKITFQIQGYPAKVTSDTLRCKQTFI